MPDDTPVDTRGDAGTDINGDGRAAAAPAAKPTEAAGPADADVDAYRDSRSQADGAGTPDRPATTSVDAGASDPAPESAADAPPAAGSPSEGAAGSPAFAQPAAPAAGGVAGNPASAQPAAPTAGDAAGSPTTEPAAPGEPERPGDAEDDAESEAQQKTRRRKGSFLRELPVLLLVALALAVLIKTFLVQAFFIPSGSMEQTLHGCAGCSGDRVLVNKLVYRFGDPTPGEVIVFRGPESWAPEAQFSEPTNPVQRVLRGIGSAIGFAPPGEKDFVKRVIAVGGQTVECCDAEGRVMVDDLPLDEPYVYLSDPNSEPTRFGPVTVPEGRLWVMGDHRDASLDSRGHIGDADQGTISTDDVIGKAFVIVWPPSRWGTLGTPETFAQASAVGATAGTPYLLAAGVIGPIVAIRRRRRRGRGR
jgi:signal peptidase I